MDNVTIHLMLCVIQTIMIFYIAIKLNDNSQSEYDRGREWACDQYYFKGRHTAWIRREMESKFEGDEFDKGVLIAVNELERREEVCKTNNQS